jgi:hypothetical protein
MAQDKNVMGGSNICGYLSRVNSFETRNLGFERLPQDVHEGCDDLVLLGRAETAVQLNVASIRDGNGDFPGLQGLRFDALAEFLAGYLDLNPREAELAIAALEDIPGIVGSGGGGQAFLEALDGDVGVEEPAESAVDEEAAGDAELDVTQVLDADPGGHAKRQDDEPRHIPVHRHQGTYGAERGARVED